MNARCKNIKTPGNAFHIEKEFRELKFCQDPVIQPQVLLKRKSCRPSFF